MKRIAIAILLVLLSSSLCAAVKDDAKVNIRFDRFYDYDEMVDVMQQLQKAYPELMKLESIGKSYQGRDMWMMIINNPDTGPESGKPGMYLDGNIHGNEIQGSETCIYTAWYLMTNYGKVERITRLVDRAVFYILPTVNPDGRAYFFSHANTSSSSRSGQKPVDDDRDGLFDEDPSDDLDGDGSITQMRKKDPNGRWKLDPEDPRLMVRAELGEEGGYVMLGSEGIDNDGDGRINEDSPGGYDLNRNWGYNWMPDYIQRGAGDYPFSHVEAKNIKDFFLKHPNLGGVQSFHNSGGMILRGPGANNRGAYPRSDVLSYDVIGKRGEQMLPNYRYMVIWKDLYTVYGGFINWTYSSLGIFSFSNELDYSGREDLTGDGKVDQKERLKFDDYLQFGAGYKEWTKYNHPLYGEIEIGGWTKFTSRVPKSWQLEETCHRNAAFTLLHAESLPDIAFQDAKVEKMARNLFKVTAVIVNRQVIPTRSMQAVQKSIGRPDIATVKANGLRIVTAGVVRDQFNNIVSVQEKDPEHLWIDSLGGNDAVRLQWVVSGSGKATIVYDSVIAGTIEKQVELK